MFDLRFNIPIPSLNQGQGRIFKIRECAQSIPRIKLPLEGHLLKKFKKFSTPTLFWTFLKKRYFWRGVAWKDGQREKREHTFGQKQPHI